MNKIKESLSWALGWLSFIALLVVISITQFAINAYGLVALCGLLYIASFIMLMHGITGATFVFILAVIVTCAGIFAETVGIVE